VRAAFGERHRELALTGEASGYDTAAPRHDAVVVGVLLTSIGRYRLGGVVLIATTARPADIVQEDERAKEGRDRDVLFPVRLDDYIFTRWEHERKLDVTNKVIADARGWDRDPAKYDEIIQRLIRDLGKPS
jgi:hypothetical protein